MKTEKSKYLYTFKNKKVRKAFQQLALDNDTSLQQLITEALETKYPTIKCKQ
jgi:hypothetical protein